uniref:C-type lectin domain-containing protein n=1 Tax=Oreochromis aureus TaxID=47969 RepID=A0A668UYH0_OREAU
MSDGFNYTRELETIMLLISYLLIHQAVTFRGYIKEKVSVTQSVKQLLLRGNCPMFWYSFNGRCYKYVATHMTNLVSIHSEEEEEFVKLLIKNFDHAERYTWIGLSDLHKEGRWMLSDGCAVSFVSWHPDNDGTNEHCVHTNMFHAKKWNDHQCSVNLAFVCATQITCP